MTNVTGMGATVLANELIPHFLKRPDIEVERIYTPEPQTNMRLNQSEFCNCSPYERNLPNSISRFLECSVLAQKFEDPSPLLVLGDIPLRVKCAQVLFLHNPHIVADRNWFDCWRKPTQLVSQSLFAKNLEYCDAVIVQTAAMKNKLLERFPYAEDRVFVVSQPPPDWIRPFRSSHVAKEKFRKDGLRLFYPASNYPHKNHEILLRCAKNTGWQRAVDRLVLTIKQPKDFTNNGSTKFEGPMRTERVVHEYLESDALIFPSLAESYGFPLIEAMWMGLPILTTDAPYSRSLCGDDAIYFVPDSEASILEAVTTLYKRLESGWFPNWKEQLSTIPDNWDDVVDGMFSVMQKVARSRPE